MPKPSTAVLMATYNGERFLAEQLDSIRNQEVNCQIFVRDDGSSDRTIQILDGYASTDVCLHRIRDTAARLGPVANFERLLEFAYRKGVTEILLSDQDDVWNPGKVQRLTDSMRRLRRTHGDIPLLVYSDMEVVDDRLRVLNPSFMHYQGIRHERDDPLSVLLVQNFVSGCTVMMNRRLLEAALPVPGVVLMHDWWLALCAAALGRIDYVDQPLVRYRQHDSNQVGAVNVRESLFSGVTHWWLQWRSGLRNLLRSFDQARELADRIEYLDPGNRHLELVRAFAALPCTSPFRRLVEVRKWGIHAQSGFRNVLMLSRMICVNGCPNGQKHRVSG